MLSEVDERMSGYLSLPDGTKIYSIRTKDQRPLPPAPDFEVTFVIKGRISGIDCNYATYNVTGDSVWNISNWANKHNIEYHELRDTITIPYFATERRIGQRFQSRLNITF